MNKNILVAMLFFSSLTFAQSEVIEISRTGQPDGCKLKTVPFAGL
ncbi:hypothetical protein MKleb_5426 (plasmid) [Klebsiella sp. PL-2018]|nr:hypothetical protein MKleb_5426 [Klebsiella sp. PL-2018]